jgi:hypothetical protein
MDTASNDLERQVITEMMNEGVPEKLIRAFGWARPEMIRTQLIQVAKDHTQGKTGVFDMTESAKHMEKAIMGLGSQGYICKTRDDGVLMIPRSWMSSTMISIPRVSLLIEPPK